MGFAGWIKRCHAYALLLLTAATCAHRRSRSGQLDCPGGQRASVRPP